MFSLYFGLYDFFLFFLFLLHTRILWPQYHKERIISRDKKMVSLAAQHSLVGHKKGPFEQRNVTEFLSKMATLKAEREEKSRAENVSRRNRLSSLLVL